MASEESEGKPLQEKRLLCSKSFDSSTNKEDEFDNRKPTSGEMSKSIVQNENTVDICSLTEEQLHSLLEEATTFNRPKEQDSCILRALRKEIVESDPCGDVNTSDSSSSLSVAAATVATVASGHGCKRKGGIGGGRNVNACASSATVAVTAGPRGGFKNLNLQISDDSLMVNHQHHTGLQGWTKSEINSCSSGSNRGSNRRWQQQQQNKGGSVASATVFKNNGGSELQSQSLQDLPSTRFGDPLVDSMRAAGVGRGNRRLHNATRANSFTYTGDGAEWLPLQTQVSALDGLRTSGSGVSGGSGRSSKSKTKSKTTSNICNNSNNNNNNNNPQTVLTIEDDINLLEATKPLVGPKGWSSVTAPTCVAAAVASAAATSPGTGGGVVDNNNKTISTTTPTSVSPLTTFSCDNCEPSSEVSLLSCRPLKDDTEVLVEKSNINGGLGVIEPKNCGNGGNDVNVGFGGGSGVCVASSSTLLPNEIEMMELDKGKSQCLDLENRSTFVYNLEGNCQGGMDCRADVDSQVTFPLKPGRICSPANKSDILCTAVQSPAAHINGILPITGRSEAVKSIIGNDDSRKGEGNTCRAATEFDKLLGKKKVTVPHTWPDDLMFYPNVDFNGNPGNPLVRMPTTFLTQGYSFDSHQNLNKVDLCSGGTSSLSSRKAKRSKSNAEKETISKAEDVDGYCGQLGIDDLVEFINSTGNEKKKPGSGGGGTSGGSSTTKSGSGVTVNNNRNSGNTESCDVKRKDRLTSSTSLNRDNTSSKGKNGFKRKNAGSNVSSSGSSEEHNGPESDRHHHHNSAESDDGDLTPVRNASPISDKDTDVIKQDRSELILQDPPSHSVPTTTTRDVIATANYVTSTTSSIVSEHEVDKEFVEDFYAVAEIQAPLEESEFRVVVNKQRKRKQNKKSEPFRRHQGNGQNDRSGNNSSSERDFYLHSQQIYSGLTHRNQRGKPDPNRRKSTSSMPPSEPSSADNSDLDSVHSLPVVGSMPPNTGPHPHTTPSSMSSTPQASYADIARMASASNATVSTTNVNYPPPTGVVSVPKKVEVVSPMETPHLPSSSSQVVPRQTTPPLNQQPVIDVLKDPFPKITETLPSPPVVAATVSVPSNTEKVVVVTTGKVHVSTSPMVSMPTSIAKPKPQIERELVTNVVVKEQVTTVVPVEPTKEQQQQPKQVENKDVAVIVADPVSTPLSSPDVVIDNNKRAPFSRGSSQDTVVVSPAAVKDSPSGSSPNPQPTTTTATTTTSKSSSSGQVNNPPVILDTVGPNAVVASSSSSRGVDVCDVSFGFDLNELMKLSEGGVPVTFDFEPTATGQQAVVRCGVGVSGKDSMLGDASLSTSSSSSDHPNLVENYVVVSSKTEQQSSSTITTTGPVGVEGTQGSTSRVLTTTAASTTTGSDVTTAESNRQLSSLVENVVVLNGGKRLKFKEKFEESAASFNHNEVANFLGFGWENVQDYQTSRSGRILYYNSSQC